MSHEGGTLSSIDFRFTYTGHGWAHATISDGVTIYEMSPSYVPQDPLFALIAAVDRVLAYGGEAECTWQYEPPADRWTLKRDGDTLHIIISGVDDGFSHPNWPTERGALAFSATCNVWAFAARVRTAASRLLPADESYHEPTRVRETPEYRALCAHLDRHKRERGHTPTNDVRP
ncbi:MAG TPA: hypothetical protein VF725_08475 [Ktedonobacterales bacterium]